MTIKVNIGTGPISVLTTATAILVPTARVSIAAMNAMNNTGSTILLKCFISANLTTVNGTQVSEFDVPVNGSADVPEIIFQGYNVGQNIIVIADAVGLELSLTFHEYTGNDA